MSKLTHFPVLGGAFQPGAGKVVRTGTVLPLPRVPHHFGSSNRTPNRTPNWHRFKLFLFIMGCILLILFITLTHTYTHPIIFGATSDIFQFTPQIGATSGVPVLFSRRDMQSCSKHAPSLSFLSVWSLRAKHSPLHFGEGLCQVINQGLPFGLRCFW